jgi:hypothetical protein
MLGIDTRLVIPLVKRAVAALETMAKAQLILAETAKLQAAVLTGHTTHHNLDPALQDGLHLVGGKTKTNGKAP